MRFKVSAPDSAIKTTVQLPSSKSISNRVLIINALSNASDQPENLSDCDDTRVMVNALTTDEEVVDIMAAGTAMRFLTAYFSVTPGCRIVTGTKRMQQRPIHLLVNALRELGAEICYTQAEGYPPLQICGKTFTKNEISLPGNMSSQYISALLMIAPVLEKGLTIELTGNIISRPYIDLTFQLMKEFGVEAFWINDHKIQVAPQAYQSRSFTVESDWSAASYWYQIVALSEDEEIQITLPGLFPNSYQGDCQVQTIFEQLGVKTTFTNDNEVILTKTENVTSELVYDFINQPDLAQTFAVTCCMLGIPFHFSGLQTLKIKETDRLTALMVELGKLGYQLEEKDNSILSWSGKRKESDPDPVIETYEDHRMAMAFAPASLKLSSIKINHPEVVSKSYPHYWEDLEKAHFRMITEE